MKYVFEFVGGFFSYFTIWTLVSFWYCYFFPSQSFLIGPMKTMVVQSSIGGFYITYIHPTQLYVPYCRMHMKGLMMKTLDLATHHLPVIFVYQSGVLFSDHHWLEKFTWMWPIFFYLSFFSLYEKYNLRSIDIAILVTIFLGIQPFL
jgi:hypothetical protein